MLCCPGPEISHIDTLGVEAFPSKTRNQVFRINGYNFGPEGTPVRVLIGEYHAF